MSVETVKHDLLNKGWTVLPVPIAACVRDFVLREDWSALDSHIRRELEPGNKLWNFFQDIRPFSKTEHIIAIRDSKNEFEEDGIWHDDGSRDFACSLSLTLSHEKIVGGKLGFRKKDAESSFEIPTPEFGTAIVFLTGVHGCEHKIHAVKEGKRIIVAIWFS